MDARWTPYLVRLTLAAVFLAAGVDHVGAEGGLAWAVRFLPFADVFGVLLAWAELAAGVGLLLGGLFPLSAGVAGFVALGAPAVVLLGGDGLAYQDLAMAGAAIYLLAHGPGPASGDAVLVRRWPRLAPWLQPWRGDGARRLGAAALRGGIAAAFLGATAASALQGQWTFGSAARITPLLGVGIFAARFLAGTLALAGVQPRTVGALALLVGLVELALFPRDYHAYIFLGLGAAYVAQGALNPAREAPAKSLGASAESQNPLGRSAGAPRG